jgi:hypothetical protein
MQGSSTDAQSVVAKSVADPTTLAAAEKLIEVLLSQSAIKGFGKSLGDLFSRRHLLDVSSCLLHNSPHVLCVPEFMAGPASDTLEQVIFVACCLLSLSQL